MVLRFVNDGSRELSSIPFEPGESPFRIKGMAYRGHLDYVAANVPGGIDAMLGALQPAQRRFFEQPFLAASLYDVFPLAQAGIPCGRLTQQSFLDFVRHRSEAQAASDVGGVYKVLLAFASPEAVATRLPRLVSQYEDFTDVEMQRPTESAVEGSARGLPRALFPWYATVCDAYVRVVVTKAGAKSCKLEATATPAGEAHGVPVVDMDFEISWSR